jgi:hypothetical protein
MKMASNSPFESRCVIFMPTTILSAKNIPKARRLPFFRFYHNNNLLHETALPSSCGKIGKIPKIRKNQSGIPEIRKMVMLKRDE